MKELLWLVLWLVLCLETLSMEMQLTRLLALALLRFGCSSLAGPLGLCSRGLRRLSCGQSHVEPNALGSGRARRFRRSRHCGGNKVRGKQRSKS